MNSPQHDDGEGPPPAKKVSVHDSFDDSDEEVAREDDQSNEVSNEEADEALRNFAAITGTDEIVAHTILQDVNWELEAALNVFYARAESSPPRDDSDDDDIEVISTGSRTQIPTQAVSTSGAARSSNVEGLEVSLVTWNIDGLDGNSLATRTKAVYKILNTINPDFVFLQEVVGRELATIQKLEKFYNIYYSNRDAQYFTAILVSKMFTVDNHSVIHYRNSGMMRTLQILEGSIGEQKVFLLNTHLESMREHSQQRREQFAQCMAKIREITTANPNCLLYFGGDLNLRDNELCEIPRGVADAWLAAGADKKEQYTFDMRQNDNKSGLHGARCRFDRVFFYGPLQRVKFSLQGKQRIRSCLCFASDHWALHCEFS